MRCPGGSRFAAPLRGATLARMRVPRRLQLGEDEDGSVLDASDPVQQAIIGVGVVVFTILILYLIWIYGKRRFWRYFQTEEGWANVVKFCAAFGYPPAVEEARRIRELERELKRAIVEDRQRQIALLFAEFKKLPHFEYKDHVTHNGIAVATAPPPHSTSVGVESAADGALANVAEQDHTTSCTICMANFRASSGCVMLPCAHIYHSDCLLRWYQTGKADDGACPICRRSFLPAQPAAERHAPTVAGETELASAEVVVASDAGEMEPAAVATTEEAMPASQPPLATGTSFTANV